MGPGINTSTGGINTKRPVPKRSGHTVPLKEAPV